MADWWREFQTDADAVDRAIEHEHQAAACGGQPWPPERQPEAGHEEPHPVGSGRDPQLEQSRPGTAEVQTNPEPDAAEPDAAGPETLAPEPTKPAPVENSLSSRLAELQARADRPRAGSTRSEQN